MAAPHLSVVIPAYNESTRLPDTLERCRRWLSVSVPSWEILVVDDGSDDDTSAIAERVSAVDPRIRVLVAPHGGKGAAVRRGMLAARGRWRFFADADLAVDLAQLPRFFDTHADVTIASREGPGAHRVGEPWSRHMIGRVFNLIVRCVALPGIHDTQCGYKLFSAEAVEQLFPHARLNGFAFDVELLYLARRSGLRIAEVPVTWIHRQDSRMRVQTGLAAFGQVLQIRWNDLLGRYSSARSRAHQPT